MLSRSGRYGDRAGRGRSGSGAPGRCCWRARGHERELGQAAERRRCGGVKRAVAADEGEPPTGRRGAAAAPRTASSSLAVTTASAPTPSSASIAISSSPVRPGSPTPLARAFTATRRRAALLASSECAVDSCRARPRCSSASRRASSIPLLTAFFVALSAWWVKGPLLVGAGPRLRPLAPAGAAGVPFGRRRDARSPRSLVGPLKDLFDRARPPEADPGLGSLVALPENASFPSGHAATAFAAATAIGILSPRMRPLRPGAGRRGCALARLPPRPLPARRARGRAARGRYRRLVAWAALSLVRRADPQPA